jgi:putative membrane protein (TIGR04086 family)
MIRWPAVLVGLLVAIAISLVAGLAMGRQPIDENPGILAVPSFLALFAGGYVAARIAGRAGLPHGIAVAVIYIFVAASIKSLQELVLAYTWGPFAVGPMNMGGLLLGDLIHLSAGTLGGWLAETHLNRTRQDAPHP